MEAIEQQLRNMTLMSDLNHDIDIIIDSYLRQQEHLDMRYLTIQPRIYVSSQVLYMNIITFIEQRHLQAELLEIMPYIDDYLEYYTEISK